MKVFHNRKVQIALVVLIGLSIAAYFGWNAYTVGYWIGDHFLSSSVHDGAYILGGICGLVMSGLILFSFFYKEYMREDVEAYSISRKDASFSKAYNEVIWWVLGFELCSVALRWAILSWSFYGLVLLGVGLVLMRLTVILGKAFHAQVNRPQEVEAMRVMDEAGHRLWEKGRSTIKGMSPDQLYRISSGDPTPIGEALSIEGNKRTRNLQLAQERTQAAEERLHRAKEFGGKFFGWHGPERRGEDHRTEETPSMNGRGTNFR